MGAGAENDGPCPFVAQLQWNHLKDRLTCIHGVQLGQEALIQGADEGPRMVDHVGISGEHICQLHWVELVYLQSSQCDTALPIV